MLNKRSQITIFVIIAILIVAAIFLIYLFYNKTLSSENNVPVFNDSLILNSEDDCANLGGFIRTAPDFKTTPCLEGETDLGFIKNIKCACHCCKTN